MRQKLLRGLIGDLQKFHGKSLADSMPKHAGASITIEVGKPGMEADHERLEGEPIMEGDDSELIETPEMESAKKMAMNKAIHAKGKGI